VDWSSRISVLERIFNRSIIGVTPIVLIGIDYNIKIDLIRKRERAFVSKVMNMRVP
jgi:hypothetical protein